MSPKKITDADKLEIVDLYRQPGETTTSLASRYGVSNSTISRLLKTSIPEIEYDLLIQQKRGAKGGNEEESLELTTTPITVVKTITTTVSEINYGTAAPPQIDDCQSHPLNEDSPPVISTFQAPESSLVTSLPTSSMIEDSSFTQRLVRRRSSSRSTDPIQATTEGEDLPTPTTKIAPSQVIDSAQVPFSRDADAPAVASATTPLPVKRIIPSPVPRPSGIREVPMQPDPYFSDFGAAPDSIAAISEDDGDEDAESEDVNVLAAMFGEEVADGEDDEDFSDDEDWDEDATEDSRLGDRPIDRNKFLTSDRLHIQVTPLSQATLPRTCYIVIDKFAELIVRPLKDFADLGEIPGEEIQQRTLPIFDNHRVAKRFSNQRTQRVIKVPDSRVFYKTTQHLRSKGITRLLVDGNIYSLN